MAPVVVVPAIAFVGSGRPARAGLISTWAREKPALLILRATV
jgi:hypothetical protein